MHSCDGKIRFYEINYEDDFGCILEDNTLFSNVDYKILHNQTEYNFIPCMRVWYNGNIQIYYKVGDLRSLRSLWEKLSEEELIMLVIKVLESIIAIKKNGFLSCQNIFLSLEKIFLDSNLEELYLVYLPINLKSSFSNYKFENELKRKLTYWLVERNIESIKLSELLGDLRDENLGIERIYEIHREKLRLVFKEKKKDELRPMRLVSLNLANPIEVELKQEKIVIGKKKEWVDVVIPYNKMISRKHCTIINKNNRYYIVDEGSANGTFLNQARLIPKHPSELKSGDRIRMADSDFQLI